MNIYTSTTCRPWKDLVPSYSHVEAICRLLIGGILNGGGHLNSQEVVPWEALYIYKNGSKRGRGRGLK